MPIGNSGVHSSMVTGNQPRAVLQTGGNVEQREPVVLGDGEAGIGRQRVVLRIAFGVALPRLNHFGMNEQAAALFAKHPDLELGRAPRLRKGMGRKRVAQAIDEGMGDRAIGPAVQIITRPRGGVDVGGNRSIAEVGRAGVVNDKVFRATMIGERPADVGLRNVVGGQVFLQRETIELHRPADQIFQRRRQVGERGGKFAVAFDRPQQAAGLGERRTRKRERRFIEGTTGIRSVTASGAEPNDRKNQYRANHAQHASAVSRK